MPCDITLYKDKNYGGNSENFGSTMYDLNNRGNIRVGRGDASSYRVNADENCLITGWRDTGLKGQGRFLRGDESDLKWRRKWNDNNWNDAFESIAIDRIPSANSSQIEYHIPIGHYTPHDYNDKYCGGCRWWPEVKDRDFKNANRDDVMIREGVTFRPCPGGNGYFNSKSGVKCIYSKTDDGAGLRQLHSNKNGIGNDPRSSMHASLKDAFCRDPENITKNPGGGTCLEFDSAKTIAESYCSKSNRIATSSAVCTKAHLGSYYDKLAEKYCKTANGQADPWCSCYNVINGVCNTNKSAAGCLDKATHYDTLVKNTPDDFKTQWAGLEGCYGGVCQGNKYIVPNANQNCDKDIKICGGKPVSAKTITNSTINTTCNLGDVSPSDDGSSSDDGSKKNGFEKGSLQDTLDKFRSKLPFGIGQLIPLSVEEVKNDTNKKVGLGGTFASSFISILIIVVIIILLSSTDTKKRVFRRR